MSVLLGRIITCGDRSAAAAVTLRFETVNPSTFLAHLPFIYFRPSMLTRPDPDVIRIAALSTASSSLPRPPYRHDRRHRYQATLGSEGRVILLSNFSSPDSQDQKKKGELCGPILSVPIQYIRASDPSLSSAATGQRTDVSVDPTTGIVVSDEVLEADPPPAASSVRIAPDGRMEVSWSDGLRSSHDPVATVEEVRRRLHLAGRGGFTEGTYPASSGVVPWTVPELFPETEGDGGGLRTALSPASPLARDFDDIVRHDAGAHGALRVLRRYGLLFVRGTPGTSDAVAAFASAMSGGTAKFEGGSYLPSYRRRRWSSSLPSEDWKVGDAGYRGGMLGDDEWTLTDGPMKTLYGQIWSTDPFGMAGGQSMADSAYSCDSLPVHTDMTYYPNPPGLQIFNVVSTASQGGESVFVDGFAVAERLRLSNPKAFQTLSTLRRTYRCTDWETGWSLEASGPVIECAGGTDSPVRRIRHNDLDRLPDLLLEEEVDHDLYAEVERAHAELNRLLGSDEYRLVVRMKAGDMVAVANQRCLHGRHSFKIDAYNRRTVNGCYVSQVDLDSRFRMLGYWC